MNSTRMQKKGQKYLLYRVLCCLPGVLILVLLFSFTPRGGELYKPDFLFGYDVYIEESHCVTLVDHSLIPEKHNIWHIKDRKTEKDIYKLLQNVECYREKDAAELLLGVAAEEQMDTAIYLETEKFGYIIRIMNWDNERTAQESVASEKKGMPLLFVGRYDMSEKTTNKDLISYLNSRQIFDSLNTTEGAGWYSTLTQEEFDELLALLESVGEENAELVH